jgi:hypothetical protein
MSKLEEIGRLMAVNYNSETDEVSVVFGVIDPAYKDFVMRWARQQEGRLVIRGEALLYRDDGQMRSSGRKEAQDADV